MAQVLVTESHLEDIADAIRLKTGQSSSYTPSQMASVIASIVSAGSLSIIEKSVIANGTYSASSDDADAFSGVVVNVPNTYNLSDEGKVVNNGSLVNQGDTTIELNGSYNTTLFSHVTVSIPETVLISKTFSESGTYDASDYSADGFSQVVINVSGGGGENDDNYMIVMGLSDGSVYDSVATIIPPYMFFYRNSTGINMLTGITALSVKTIGSQAFERCTELSYASFPTCTRISVNAFNNCHTLSSVLFPNVEIIENGCFYSCSALTEIKLNKCTRIGSSAFRECRKLESVYLLKSEVATLVNANAFQTTPISNSTYLGHFGSIFVPASLVDAYKSALNWSNYSGRITAYVEE